MHPNARTFAALIDGAAKQGPVAKAFGTYSIMMAKVREGCRSCAVATFPWSCRKHNSVMTTLTGSSLLDGVCSGSEMKASASSIVKLVHYSCVISWNEEVNVIREEHEREHRFGMTWSETVKFAFLSGSLNLSCTP